MGGGRGGCGWPDRKGGCQPRGGWVLGGRGGARWAGRCQMGGDGGGWEGVQTKGKGEIGSLDHVRMCYVGSSGASSPSSSVESSVLSSSSCSGNLLRRCKTSFLMTILLVR
jgi:hypothetical protein